MYEYLILDIDIRVEFICVEWYVPDWFHLHMFHVPGLLNECSNNYFSWPTFQMILFV